MTDAALETVAAWLGRTVRYSEEPDREAIILAVDDTPYAPSAWIRFDSRRPTYRSVDLSDLTHVETGESGPRWGTGGMEADAALDRDVA